MRIFIAVLVLIFSLQSWTKADDISDFEIEGMSIGDSLLDYFSEKEILNANTTIYPNSKKFYDIHLILTSSDYNQITITVKKDDKKYFIQTLSGEIYFTDEEEKCLIKKKEITNKFINILPTLKKKDYRYQYKTVDDGKSYAEITDFKFKDGSSKTLDF